MTKEKEYIIVNTMIRLKVHSHNPYYTTRPCLAYDVPLLQGLKFQGQQRQMRARENQQRLSLLSEEVHNDILFGCDPAADQEEPGGEAEACSAAEAKQVARALAVAREQEAAAAREAAEETGAAAALEADAA